MPKPTVLKKSTDYTGKALSKPKYMAGVRDDNDRLVAYVPVSLSLKAATDLADEMTEALRK